MGRQIETRRLRKAWNHLKAGGSLQASGLHPEAAELLRRLQVDGWAVSRVEEELRVNRAGGLKAIAGHLPSTRELDPIVPRTVRHVAAHPPAESPMTLIEGSPSGEIAPRSPVALGPLFLDVRERRRDAIQADYEEGQAMRDLGLKMLQSADPHIRVKETVREEIRQCSCGKDVVVQITIQQPLPQDVQGAVALLKTGSELTRRSLAMPKGIGNINPRDLADIEPRWKMDALRQSIASGLEKATKEGMLTPEESVRLWGWIADFNRQQIAAEQRD